LTADGPKRIVVLGSTGSIGVNTLTVARSMPARLEVTALSANAQWEELARQIREFRPVAAAIADPEQLAPLKDAVGGLDVELLPGPDGVSELAGREDADIVVNAVTGWAGFAPTIRALEAGHVLALANKESLVVGGEIVMDLVARCGGTLLPVDSEQSAVLQAMRSGRAEEVARVIITASGGPFRGASKEVLRDVTPQQALQHPTWRMGSKITIDSATMMNKALEIIETHWLFDLEPDRIAVLIHPQSIVHGMVEFVDGSLVAQLGAPDMKLPIQLALTYPDRVAGPAQRLDLASAGNLELLAADPEEFPALALGYEVVRRGGASGAALNAANEAAVDLFLQGAIRFTDIVPLVAAALERFAPRQPHRRLDVADLERADCWARQEVVACSAQ